MIPVVAVTGIFRGVDLVETLVLGGMVVGVETLVLGGMVVGVETLVLGGMVVGVDPVDI